MNDRTLDEFQVVMLSATGTERDPIAKVLKQEGFRATFVSDPAKALELLASTRSATLLHDWAALDPLEGAKLHQTLARMPEHAGLCRIIYAQAVTPELLGLASDTGVKRLISYQTTILNVIGEIKMALHAVRNMTGLQAVIHAGSHGGYDQADVDGTVRRAYDQFRHDPVVRLEFGNLCLREGDVAKSKDIAGRLLQVEPQNVRAMNLLARSMMREGRLDEATKLLETANGLSPFNTDRLLLLGDAFLSKGDNGTAASYFSDAMSLEPGSLAAQKGLGTAKLNDGEVNAALDLLKNSASEEEAAGLFNNAAVHAAKQGRDEDSLRLYQSALGVLRTDKLKPVVYFNVALALTRLGQYQEAMRAVKRVLKYAPKHEKAGRLAARLAHLSEWNTTVKEGSTVKASA